MYMMLLLCNLAQSLCMWGKVLRMCSEIIWNLYLLDIYFPTYQFKTYYVIAVVHNFTYFFAFLNLFFFLMFLNYIFRHLDIVLLIYCLTWSISFLLNYGKILIIGLTIIFFLLLIFSLILRLLLYEYWQF